MGNKQSSKELIIDESRVKKELCRKSFIKKKQKTKKIDGTVSFTTPVANANSKYNGHSKQILKNSSVDSLISDGTSTSRNSSGFANKAIGSHKVEIKIFRSITNLNDSGRVKIIPSETPSNFRVYKRNVSPETLLKRDNSTSRLASRSNSLPRGFGKNRTIRASTTSSSSIENLENIPTYNRKTLSSTRSSTTSRSSGFVEPLSKNYKVNQSDFPEFKILLKRLSHFKTTIVTYLVNQLLLLPIYKQLSIIPLATIIPSSQQATNRKVDEEGSNYLFDQPKVISLRKYLEEDGPLTPSSPSSSSKFHQSQSCDVVKLLEQGISVLHIPVTFLNDLIDLKLLWHSKILKNISQESSTSSQQNENDLKFIKTIETNPDLCLQTTSLTKRLFSELSEESANELIRIYEYQIGLLNSEFSIELLARHCVDRMMTYVQHAMKVPLIDTNSLVIGVLRGQVMDTPPPAVVSIIIGQKELKWNLYDILDKPGLRTDALLDKEHILDPTLPNQNIFNFYAASFSNPMIYGYRGQVIEMDYSRCVFRPFAKEVDTFSEEVLWRYDDFHRLYAPFQMMVGSKALRRFSDVHNQQIKLEFEKTCNNDKKTGSIGQNILNGYIINMLRGTMYEKENVKVLSRPFQIDEKILMVMQMLDPCFVERMPQCQHLITNKHHCNYKPQLSGFNNSLDDLPVFDKNITISPFQSLTSQQTSTPSWTSPKSKIDEVSITHVNKCLDTSDTFKIECGMNAENRGNDLKPTAQSSSFSFSTPPTVVHHLKNNNTFEISAAIQSKYQSNGSPHLPSTT